MMMRERPRCRIFLLDGKKFRRNLLVLFFELPLQRELATKTALLAEVLKGQDRLERTKGAEELYGAVWDISVVKKGDKQLLLFSLETIKIVDTAEALAFLRQMIFSGREKGCFEEKLVERQREILGKRLEAQQDNKRAYARKRVSEETAEGTAYAISGDGYVEDLGEISGKGLYRFYERLLEQEEVKVFFCGDRGEKTKILELRKDFPGKISHRKTEETEQPKNGPRFVQERAELEQARLLLGFSVADGNSRRRAANLLLRQILGGDGDSFLFQRVREEQGLCYDVKAYMEPMMPYLFLQAGMRQEDAKQAGKEMLRCIEELKKDGVSEEKLRQAKETLLRQVEGLGDSPWGMVDFFAEQSLQGLPLSTERLQRQLQYMEAEDIHRAAEKLELRVVYLLSREEAGDDAE